MDSPHDEWSPHVVLLHGLTGSRRFFAWLEGQLRGDPTRAKTLSFDLSGFGDNKELAGDYGLSDHLKFISSAIDHQFPSGRLVLIGHSLGGVLALAWAVEHQERVSQIVLLNTPLGDSRGEIVHSLLHERLGWAGLLLRHRHLAHIACLVLRGAQGIRAFWLAKPRYVSDDVFRDYTRHSWRALTETFDQVLLGVPGGPLVRRIRSTPILNLTARSDREIARKAIEQPNVHTVALPGGHLMLLEYPDSTLQAIEQFLHHGSDEGHASTPVPNEATGTTVPGAIAPVTFGTKGRPI